VGVFINVCLLILEVSHFCKLIAIIPQPLLPVGEGKVELKVFLAREEGLRVRAR